MMMMNKNQIYKYLMGIKIRVINITIIYTKKVNQIYLKKILQMNWIKNITIIITKKLIKIVSQIYLKKVLQMKI